MFLTYDAYFSAGSNCSAICTENLPGNQLSGAFIAEIVPIAAYTGVDMTTDDATMTVEECWRSRRVVGPGVLEQRMAAAVSRPCLRIRPLNVSRVIAVGVYELCTAGFAVLLPPDFPYPPLFFLTPYPPYLVFEGVMLHKLSSMFHCSAVKDPLVKMSAI